MEQCSFFASAAKGVIAAVADELRAIGATDLKEYVAGIAFNGSLETGYRACLWSRTASRILLQLAQFPAPDEAALYRGIQRIDWPTHFSVDKTLAIDANTRKLKLNHSRFIAQKTKDAIVDQFSERLGQRPYVDLENPDIRLNVFLVHDVATVYLDLSGPSLHRRGYRDDTVAAPLKQNLAAAILLRAGWPDIARAGGALVDPMCGSGTFLIEAAWMAMDQAPGLYREGFGFEAWLKHDTALWQRLIDEARERADAGAAHPPVIHGYDIDQRSVRAARANVAAAGLKDIVTVDLGAVADLPAAPAATGLLVTNPPYGERLGDVSALETLYAELGHAMREKYAGWQAAVLTGNPPLGKALGLRARRVSNFHNGAIECKLLRFDLSQAEALPSTDRQTDAQRPLSAGAQMVANRLTKNLNHLRRWARRENISCFRLYDADMPEYAAAIDIYQTERTIALVQEYEAPKTVDTQQARQRLRDILHAVPRVLEIPRDDVVLKQRARQRGASQYQRSDEQGRFHVVTEGPCRFQVNFTDYLDTGLFLDHRITRARVGAMAAGKSLLNLFCYTATASVHAALAGAKTTHSVDMSATYLDWARRNCQLNNLDLQRHTLEQADCLQWLTEQSRSPYARRFDVIFLDPPTFSNSKRMEGTLDIQRDHVGLISQCMKLLAADGTLVFSTNLRSFKIDNGALTGCRTTDISAATIPQDFERNPRIHRCFEIVHQ